MTYFFNSLSLLKIQLTYFKAKMETVQYPSHSSPAKEGVLSKWTETKGAKLPCSFAEAGFRNGMNGACIRGWHGVLSASRGDQIRHMFRYINVLSPL